MEDQESDAPESQHEGAAEFLAEDADGTTRRDFLRRTAAGTVGIALGGSAAGCAGTRFRDKEVRRQTVSFESNWPQSMQRIWLGPAYWTNPLQDWRLAEGKVEMVNSGPNRNVQLLTRQLGERRSPFWMRTHVGFYDRPGEGRAGFMLGVQGPLADYRSAAVYGEGLKAGLTSGGQLFIGDRQQALSGEMKTERGAMLEVVAEPQETGYQLTLSARHTETGEVLGQVQRGNVAPERLVGNVALLAEFEDADGARTSWGVPRLWFRDWQVGGDKVETNEERTFGPILFNQYTLSRGTMKMTAQLPPVGEEDGQVVHLQTQRGGRWQTLADAPVDALSRTATLRVDNWEDTRDVPYRLAYRYQVKGGGQTHHYRGTVRHDPVGKDDLVVAGLSCQYTTGFPYPTVAAGLRQHDPDLLAFTGDQYYEGAGGYGVRRLQGDPGPAAIERATLDMLRKWYLHGWAFGEVRRDRPTICMTDDHDVFQGNIWGEGGKDIDRWELHRQGGYLMPAEWVNAVQRTQTSHLPDPVDPTPVRNGITVYYTDMLYGRVSFAILEDRKWKSGPDGLVPAHPGRADHVEDLNYDASALDAPAAELLGRRQLEFLDEWTADWRGADMKTVVSQSLLAQVPTHHGFDYRYLAVELDANGWPQTGRDEALRRFRKGFAFHLGGDQHLPMMVQYGIKDFDDAGYNFSVPAIATGYPRAFWPSEIPSQLRHRFEGSSEGTGPGMRKGPGPSGRYTDGLGNKMTLHAVANPAVEPRSQKQNVLAHLADKSSGYGIVRFHKPDREITMEAWPILSDPSGGDEQQYAGWPKTVKMEENYGRAAEAYLPTLKISGAANPVVQVIDEGSGEVVYTLRIQGRTFRPKVFRAEGTYTVRVGKGDRWQKIFEAIQPVARNQRDALNVRL